jgi:hypothetical protein
MRSFHSCRSEIDRFYPISALWVESFRVLGAEVQRFRVQASGFKGSGFAVPEKWRAMIFFEMGCPAI